MKNIATRSEIIQNVVVSADMIIRQMENALIGLEELRNVVGGEKNISDAMKALGGNFLLNKVGAIDKLKTFRAEMVEIAEKEGIDINR